MFEADQLLLLVSSTLIISYVSTYFYSKTKIPDILWVLAFGIVLGPVLGYFDKDMFLSISPLMSTLALSIILFEAGLTLDIAQLMKSISKATILSISTILTVIAVLGYALPTLYPTQFNVLEGMLLGAMIGGTSTVAVFSILSELDSILPDIDSTRVILLMESVISDPICIISSITLIRMIMLPEVSLQESMMNILMTFILSSLLGLAMGQMWSEMLDKLRGSRFTYIMTLALLWPTYIIAEHVIGEGGGPMAALCFGLMINNYGYITHKIGVDRNLKIDKEKLKEFHEEITFFIKSFFFVYVGLIVSLSVEFAIMGGVVLGLIFLVRFTIVLTVGSAVNFNKQEKVLSMLIYASGLPAFVMSQLPLVFDPERVFFTNPEIYPNMVMPIVLGTVLFAALTAPNLAKRLLK